MSDNDTIFQNPLTLEDPIEQPTDYTLKEGHTSCWITVKNTSVYLRNRDGGVHVDIYPRGHEHGPPLGSTFVDFEEAQEIIDEFNNTTNEEGE